VSLFAAYEKKDLSTLRERLETMLRLITPKEETAFPVVSDVALKRLKELTATFDNYSPTVSSRIDHMLRLIEIGNIDFATAAGCVRPLISMLIENGYLDAAEKLRKYFF
jgi:hypothetical protein